MINPEEIRDLEDSEMAPLDGKDLAYSQIMDAIQNNKKNSPELEAAVRAALEELENSVKVKRSTRPRVDPLVRIASLNSIAEVRKAIKVAHAKKSKAKDNPESFARYEEEIKLGQDKLNSLLAQAGNDPKALLAMGEEPAKIAQQYVISKEEYLKGALESLPIKKSQLKKMIQDQTELTPNEYLADIQDLGFEVVEIFTARSKKEDQRVRNVIRMARLLKHLNDHPEEVSKLDSPPPQD